MYRPGDKNVKADSLSHIHASDEPSSPEPILPPAVLVSPIWWALDEQIRIASITEPAPLGCPEGKTYLPTSLRTTLLGSLYASLSSGHPGSQCTLAPTSLVLVAQYGPGCLPVRSWMLSLRHLQNSTSLTAGKLVPLPIPCRPWSHVGVDFVKYPHKSEGYTCVLVAVVRFSKACNLIPLLLTAEALFHNLFRNFRNIPEDVISYRWPQFVSCVWKAPVLHCLQALLFPLDPLKKKRTLSLR